VPPSRGFSLLHEEQNFITLVLLSSVVGGVVINTSLLELACYFNFFLKNALSGVFLELAEYYFYRISSFIALKI
jgi:hypothetical protein